VPSNSPLDRVDRGRGRVDVVDPVDTLDPVRLQACDRLAEIERVTEFREGACPAVNGDHGIAVHDDENVSRVAHAGRDGRVDVLVGIDPSLRGEDTDGVAARLARAATDRRHDAAATAADHLVAARGEYLTQSFGRRRLVVDDPSAADDVDSNSRGRRVEAPKSPRPGGKLIYSKYE